MNEQELVFVADTTEIPEFIWVFRRLPEEAPLPWLAHEPRRTVISTDDIAR